MRIIIYFFVGNKRRIEISEPIVFCKKRMGNLERLMVNNDIDLVYLVKSGMINFS